MGKSFYLRKIRPVSNALKTHAQSLCNFNHHTTDTLLHAKLSSHLLLRWETLSKGGGLRLQCLRRCAPRCQPRPSCRCRHVLLVLELLLGQLQLQLQVHGLLRWHW